MPNDVILPHHIQVTKKKLKEMETERQFIVSVV